MALPKVKISWKTGAVIVAGVVLLGASGYFGWQYFRSQELLKNPTAAAIQEINDLVRIVGKHAILPEGEQPTVATVSDRSKLASMAFFSKAEEGDKVLIYAKEGRAILYRPSINRIVEITTVVQPTVTPEVQLTGGTMVIFNGTQTQGLASVAETKVISIKSIKVVGKQNSIKDYDKTVVVLLNSKARNLATELAGLVKAEVVDLLPEGETKPEADLLLILGEDYK